MFLMPDISHWQGSHTSVDMVKVANEAGAIMLKATEGTGFIDDEFVLNVISANGAQLPWGAYHFVRPGHGTEQANHFINTALSVSNCRFLCIDWEDGSRDTVLALAKRLRERAPVDVAIGDYIGSHARALGGQLPDMSFHMVPQYGTSKLDDRYRTDPLSAWQYTNGESNGTDWPSSIPGIGPCDVSAVFRPQDFGLLEEDVALTEEEINSIAAVSATELATRVIGKNPNGTDMTAAGAWRQASWANDVHRALANLPEEIAAELPSNTTLTKEEIQTAAARAVRTVLGSLDNPEPT